MTIEDVANLLMLPILDDIDPTKLRLTVAESVIEEELLRVLVGKVLPLAGILLSTLLGLPRSARGLMSPRSILAMLPLLRSGLQSLCFVSIPIMPCSLRFSG